MKCEKCGRETDSVLVGMFNRDGKDFYKPIASTKIFFSQSEAEAQLSAEYREEEK